MFTSFVLHSSNPADENHPTYHIRLPSFLHLRIAPCAATPHPHGHTSLPYALIPFPLARRANLRRQSVVDLRNKHPRRHRQPLPAPPPDRRDRSLRCRLRRSLPAPPHLTHNSLPHALIPFPLAHRADLRRQSIVDPHNQRPWWQSAIDPCHHAVLAMILRGQTLVLSPALSMMVDQLRKLHAFLPDGLLASSQAYASEFCRKEHQALEISLIYVKENKGAATVASTEAWSDTKIEGERLISVVHF
uniref:Uncharacterized protein n=1 Tax=Oryza rufipogon TaxID=4529 RepID=A0A0E0QHH3_ORYRU